MSSNSGLGRPVPAPGLNSGGSRDSCARPAPRRAT